MKLTITSTIDEIFLEGAVKHEPTKDGYVLVFEEGTPSTPTISMSRVEGDVLDAITTVLLNNKIEGYSKWIRLKDEWVQRKTDVIFFTDEEREVWLVGCSYSKVDVAALEVTYKGYVVSDHADI